MQVPKRQKIEQSAQIPVEIWLLIAQNITPNPFVYLRLSHLCRTSRAAFLRDELWRQFDPYPETTALASKFLGRLARKPPQIVNCIIGNYFRDVAARQTTFELLHQFHHNKSILGDWDWMLSVFYIQLSPPKDLVPQDESFWRCCVRLTPASYELAPLELQTSVEFTILALQSGLNPFCIPVTLLENATVAPLAIQIRPMILSKMTKSFIEHNKPLVRAAVANDAWALSSAHKFRGDKDIAMLAVQQSGQALGFVSESLKSDRDLVTVAVKNYGSALKYASPALLADKKIVLLAVSHCGSALKDASTDLRADKQVVLAAVANDAESRRYASSDLQFDTDVVMAALMKMKSH